MGYKGKVDTQMMWLHSDYFLYTLKSSDYPKSNYCYILLLAVSVNHLCQYFFHVVTPDIVRILSKLNQLKYLSLSNGESKIPINYFFDICKIKLETLKLKSIQFDLQFSNEAVSIWICFIFLYLHHSYCVFYIVYI